MKKSLTVLVIVFLLIGVLSGSALAGKFSYSSGIQVQNMSADDAGVTLTYYNQDGTVDASVGPDTITGNSSKTYFPVGASDGFNGSVVISSDQPVAAISNVLGNDGVAAASYVGSSAGGTTVNLPLLMAGNGSYDSWFNVMNTGSADTIVNVAYSDGTTAGPVTIQPGAAHTFDQAAETHSATVFSGVVTSADQPVAVTVIEESPTIMFAYSGFASGSQYPVMPLINANNGPFVTGVQIQNTGGTATDVSVVYTAATGTDCIETQTIAANSSATFALAAFDSGANSDCVAGATFVGAAAVTVNSAGHDLTVIVNQLGAVNGEAYGGFDPALATDTVVMPLIMDRNGGYWTGFNIQNVGLAATTVNCTFTGSTHTESATLAPGEALNALQGGVLADGYVGSATCTATGGSILGVVNEVGPSGTTDQLMVYEGIND